MELLVTLVILFSLGSITIIIYPSFQTRTELDIMTNDVIQHLRRARTKALTGEGNTEYGVHIENDKFTFFKGSTYMQGSFDNEITVLPDILTITDINFSGTGTSVVFEKGTGKALIPGTFTVRIINGDGRIVNINEIGNIEWNWE